MTAVPDRGEVRVEHAVAVTGSRVSALALQGLTLLILARSLGAYDFGVFSLVLLVQSLVTVVSNGGVSVASQYHSARQVRRPDHVVSLMLVSTVFVSAIFTPATTLVLAWLHPVLLRDLPFDLLILGTMAGPIRLGSEALSSAFIALGDVHGQTWVVVFGPLLFLSALLLSAILGVLDVDLAVRAWLVSNVIALAFALYAFGRHGKLLPPRDLLADRTLWRDVAGVAAAGYLFYVIYWASMRLDRVALNAVGGAAPLGVFALGAWVAEAFMLLPISAGNLAYPRLSSERAGEAADAASAAVRATFVLAAVLGVPALLGVAVAGSVLGGVISDALPIVVVLLPGYIALTPLSIFVMYLVAKRRVFVGAAYFAVLSAAKVALILTLYPRGGIALAAAGVSAAGLIVGGVALAHMARAFARPIRSIGVPGRADWARVRYAGASGLGLIRR